MSPHSPLSQQLAKHCKVSKWHGQSRLGSSLAGGSSSPTPAGMLPTLPGALRASGGVGISG
eukprot:2999490-Alexandrium_andersonii.AAC.1